MDPPRPILSTRAARRRRLPLAGHQLRRTVVRMTLAVPRSGRQPSHVVLAAALALVGWSCSSNKPTEVEADQLVAPSGLYRDDCPDRATLVMYAFAKGPETPPADATGIIFAAWPDGFVLFRPTIYDQLHAGRVPEQQVAEMTAEVWRKVADVPRSMRFDEPSRPDGWACAVYDDRDGVERIWAGFVDEEDDPRIPAVEACWGWVEALATTKGALYENSPALTWKGSTAR